MNFKTPNIDGFADYEKINKQFADSLPEYDDGESPIELWKRQAEATEKSIPAIQQIAESAKSQSESAANIASTAHEQSESAKQIANNSKTQADIAVKKSKKADVKGWIAIIISAFALLIEFATNYSQVTEFLKSLFNN